MDNTILENIINDHFVLREQYDLAELTQGLMQNLASSYTKRRDYSYMILSTWISNSCNSTPYNKKQLIELGEIAKTNIQKGLSNSECDDSIFLRAYSILVFNYPTLS